MTMSNAWGGDACAIAMIEGALSMHKNKQSNDTDRPLSQFSALLCIEKIPSSYLLAMGLVADAL